MVIIPFIIGQSNLKLKFLTHFSFSIKILGLEVYKYINYNYNNTIRLDSLN